MTAVRRLTTAAAALALTPGVAHGHAGGIVGPDELWHSWPWDPGAVALLAIAGCAYLIGTRALWRRAGRGRGITSWRALCYAAGWTTVAVALLTPLDPLGETLFSAHMVQHLLLMGVAPPLLVLGMPHVAALWALPTDARRGLARAWNRTTGARTLWHGATAWPVALALHGTALWAWHLPTPYEAALARPAVHALEHACFVGTAILVWWRILLPRSDRRNARALGVLMLLALLIEGGALGAVLALARAPWYPVHGLGARAWGMTALEDQQLAGLIMWVPGGLLYVALAGALFASWLRERADGDGFTPASRPRISEVTA